MDLWEETEGSCCPEPERPLAEGRNTMSEPTIANYFQEDHARLDALFKAFQELKRSDYAKAKESFKEFKFGLQRHIVWEEDLLFPLWEQHTGMSDDGPTADRAASGGNPSEGSRARSGK